eukprot:1137325_1
MAHPEQQSVPRRKLSISTHFKDSCNIHEENVPPCNGNTDDQSLSNDQNHSEDCAPPFSHVCECGQEFTNSGAYARHKGSKKCEKKKKHKNASKNVLDIRDFMNGRAKRNKNRTSSSSSQKAEQSDSNDDSDMSSGQMPRSDSNDNDDDDDDDNHRTHADDNHRTHPHAINTAAKWKFVLLDQNNEIVEKIESKSTNCSKKEPKKASKILNKKKKDPFGDTLRLITKANHAAPCTVCGKVIAAKDLYTHHSLHFATTSGTPPTAQCALSITPQFRYVIKEGKVYFEEIPNNARKALTARDCLICCSNQCSHYLIPKSKKVAEYAVSNCPLFYPYSVKAVRTRMTSLNASNPSVILPVKCSICGEWINSYLMELHLQEDHNKLDSFGTSHTHVPSQKHMELAIAKLEEVGKSKGRITKKWIQLCVSQTVSKSNAAQKTASEKYGMRSTKYNSKRFFSELSSTQHDDNISRNHNKKKRKLR